MNKLPPSVRNNLIRKASDIKKKRWTLRSLAAMNETSSSNTNATCSTSTSTSANSSPKENNEKRPVPPSIVADTLLSEVNVRLARQHKKCLEMIDEVSGNKVHSSSLSNDNDEEKSPTRRIIRAVNNPMQGMSFKEWMHRSQVSKKEKEVALKALNDLEILHADTFAITEHLLSNDKPTLRRFSKADQSLIAATFEQIRSRHASTVENLADVVVGIRKLKDISEEGGTTTRLDQMLVDEFLRDRLGIQLLCDHYVGLNRGKPGGGIAVNCSFSNVLTDAITEAKSICDANFGIAPEVHVLFDDSTSSDDATVTLIRPWVHHALVELLKNGMTSSVQKGDFAGVSLPPDLFVSVSVRRHVGEETLLCEIMDQGVGLNDEGLKNAFRFADSSSEERWDRIDEQQSYAMVRAPIASLGVGLSLSQMMMQMFGGEVHLKSRRESELLQTTKSVQLDSGCSATLHLPLCDDIKEL